MISSELTESFCAATSCTMQFEQPEPRSGWRAARAAMLLGGSLAISACVQVSAPDKPIVIELNINIKQEVVYRLDSDAKQTIEGNSGIF